MTDSIIVTVRFDRLFYEDMELPAGMPVGTLTQRLLDVLKQAEPGCFGKMRAISLLHNGACLDDLQAALSDYGIVNGDYLEIVQEE